MLEELKSFWYSSSKMYSFNFFFWGLLSSFSLPNLYLLPLGIFGFYKFFKNIFNVTSYKQIFFYGSIFSFGYFLFGFHWIIFPLLVEKSLIFFIPVVLLLFPLFLSLFLSLPILLIGIYKNSFFLRKNLIFANTLIYSLLIFVFEYLRSIVWTGFPWNLFSHIWAFNNNFMIISKYIGVHGLSFLTIFWLILISHLLIYKLYRFSFFVFLGFPAFLFIFGSTSVAKPLDQQIQVRLVQPNISQELKWKNEYKIQHLKKLINLSLEKKSKFSHRIVVWPEVAITEFLNENDQLISFLKKSFEENEVLISGGLRRENGEIFNTFYKIDSTGYSHFDKIKLVPFGEFMPFRSFFPFKTITHDSKDFSKGTKKRVLKISELDVFIEPSICYEGIFKNVNSDEINLIINITNDAWFGSTSGPYQHLVAARFRSLERGLPLLRVANSGISGAYDINGKLLKSIDLNTDGFVDLNMNIGKNDSVFSKFGNIVILYLIIFMLIVSLLFDFFIFKKRLLKN